MTRRDYLKFGAVTTVTLAVPVMLTNKCIETKVLDEEFGLREKGYLSLGE